MNKSDLQYPGDSLRAWLRRQERAEYSDDELTMLAGIADTLFFASLGKEEGEFTGLRVAYHPLGLGGLQEIREQVFVGSARYDRQAWESIPFMPADTVTEFSVKALVKLAPAANLPRTSIVVGPVHGHLAIQGIARRVKYEYFHLSEEDGVLVFHAPEPGHLTLSIHGEEVFRHERGSLVAPARMVSLYALLFNKDSLVRAALMRMCESLLDRLPEPLVQLFYDKGQHVSRVFYGLIKRMGVMRHGGLIAVMPDSSAIEKARARGKYKVPREAGVVLRNSLIDHVASQNRLNDLRWRRAGLGAPRPDKEEQPDDDGLDDAIAQQDKENDEEELDALVDNIGQLTAVDNALLLGPDLEVVSAGYPIPTRRKPPQVHETEALSGERSTPYDIGQHGSRHRAAAVFASEYPGGLAFVASQDGPLRCLHRPPGQDRVLLWNIRIPDE